MKQTKKRVRDKICYTHKVRFKDCPLNCGYRMFYIRDINARLVKRAKRLRRKLLERKKRLAEQRKIEKANARRFCRCGQVLMKAKRLCSACKHEAAKKKQALKKQPLPRYCHTCKSQLPRLAKKYCSTACKPKTVKLPDELIHTSCRVCSLPFTTSIKSKKFCSQNCSAKAKRIARRSFPETASCKMCGEVFSPINSKHVFCSEQCCDRHHHLSSREKKKALRVKTNQPQVERACVICSKAFTTPHQTKIYCNHQCSLKAQRRRKRLKEKGRKRPPHEHVKHRLSGRLRELLRRKGQQKQNSITAYMGCSPKEMVRHVEGQFSKGMTWENYGVFGWHLDHIIPCARFDLTREDHCKVCFNWRNIRPLWGENNWIRQEMLTLDEALNIDPELIRMANEVGVRLW